jgi:hypothetical protein
MSFMRLVFLVVVLLANFTPTARAQQHQPREWHCVRQVFIETNDGDVVPLQCLAALPKDEKLDAEDEDILTTLEVARLNAKTFRQLEKEDPKRGPTDDPNGIGRNGLRIGFSQKVGQLCQKHPNVVLAPLFPDLTPGTTTLYGCKNITAAPEK